MNDWNGHPAHKNLCHFAPHMDTLPHKFFSGTGGRSKLWGIGYWLA